MPTLPEIKDTSMPKRRQRGFSLLELLVAMMIIGAIATLGFRGYMKHAAEAKHMTAADKLKIMADGLDTYYIQFGKYPEGGTWNTLIAADSPLVKTNTIPANMPTQDPWGQPFEAEVTKVGYKLRCAGDPSNPDNPKLGEIVREPGKIAGDQGGAAKPEAKPAEGAAK